MTTKAQNITVSSKTQATKPRYSDFTNNLDVHPDTKDIFRFTDINAVKKSMRNLVFTDKYERLFRPNIGCGIRALLFENLQEDTLISIKDTIKEVIENYEPRVVILEIQAIGTPDNNSVVVNIAFQIVNVSETQFMQITVDRAR